MDGPPLFAPRMMSMTAMPVTTRPMPNITRASGSRKPARMPIVEATATPALPSAFMSTAAHWPPVTRQVSCC